MIHYTPDGHHIKLGLNFSSTSGGFCLLWVWYNFATYTATTYRLRVRLHMAPRTMWETKTWNVIDNYLMLRNLELVHKEVLEDLYSLERAEKRINESYAIIKPT
jgi:hypothetical protein